MYTEDSFKKGDQLLMLEMNNAFNISILASGSTGNSLYLESPQKRILVDAGLSGKKITSLLAEVDRKPEDLDAILVTHDHRDHIHGVGVLARKYKLPVYANEKTWEAMAPLIGKVDVEQKHIFEMGKVLTLGDLDIESFGVSHDAAAPQCYASEHVRGPIRDADAYLVESNHDLEMLRMGAYPWSLKQRILGDRGHLSNDDGALVMTDILGDRTKRIYLGHLSKENNMKELAHMTMEETLTRYDLGVNHQFQIFDTDPDSATELYAI